MTSNQASKYRTSRTNISHTSLPFARPGARVALAVASAALVALLPACATAGKSSGEAATGASGQTTGVTTAGVALSVTLNGKPLPIAQAVQIAAAPNESARTYVFGDPNATHLTLDLASRKPFTDVALTQNDVTATRVVLQRAGGSTSSLNSPDGKAIALTLNSTGTHVQLTVKAAPIPDGASTGAASLVLGAWGVPVQ